MKIAIYARVSTLDKGQDVTLQLEDLRRYAQAEGLQVYREYIDDGISGAKENRPAFNAMMDDARHGKFQAVIIWKMSRFSRKLEHLLKYVGVLQDLKIDFVSIKDKIDTSTPIGRFFFHVKGAFDEFERENTRENIIAGLTKLDKDGKRVKGYSRKGKRLGARPKSIDLDRVRELKVQGLSLRAIAKEVGVSYMTVRRKV